MRLGVIADDMTGAADVALMLSKSGLRAIQTIGAPDRASLPDADAVVVALKTRTAPASDAVAQSRAALAILREAGARQIQFKYCSTFDSTPSGNIGPVADALLDDLGAHIALVCPAFPANGRTIYQGRLFVGDLPLDESPMKDHPLTPMRDASLVRLMAGQTSRPVGLLPHSTVARGPDAVRAALARLSADGVRYAVADAIADSDLLILGRAAADAALVTGGSGIAHGLADNFRDGAPQSGPPFAAPDGRMAIIAGSCSAATRGQVKAALDAGLAARALDVRALLEGRLDPADLAAWALAQAPAQPILIYSSADPAEVAATQAAFGRDRAGAAVEEALADIAARLVAGGARRLIVAGGETSGAVVQRLGVRALEIGPEIAPGVPWTRSIGEPDLALALKSGNFGQPDFFVSAWRALG